MNGKQCKVLQGFGNTICTRLDQKLAEYHSSQATDIAVSPVLKPLGQFSEPRRESPRKDFPGKDGKNDLENIPLGENEEDVELELVRPLSQQERSEEEDLQLALRLSQGEHVDDDYQLALELSQSPQAKEHEASQEDLDRELALKLQEDPPEEPTTHKIWAMLQFNTVPMAQLVAGIRLLLECPMVHQHHRTAARLRLHSQNDAPRLCPVHCPASSWSSCTGKAGTSHGQ